MPSRYVRPTLGLTARGKSPAAFGRRCIPSPPQRGCRVGPRRWLRCSSLKYCPIFSVVAPCHRGASPASVRRRDFHHGLLGAVVALIVLIARLKVHPFIALIVVSLAIGGAAGMPLIAAVKTFQDGVGAVL